MYDVPTIPTIIWYPFEVLTESDDISKSTTVKNLGKRAKFHYADDSIHEGIFVTDTVSFGGVSIDNVQFGVVDNSSGVIKSGVGRDAAGIMGVGAQKHEFVVIANHEKPYPNILTELQRHGHIRARAYSLWLNGFGPSYFPTRMRLRLTALTRSHARIDPFWRCRQFKIQRPSKSSPCG